MNQETGQIMGGTWVCINCQISLEPGKVAVSYLDNTFPVDLLRCPQCGLALVPEELAMGKMAEVERTLEDK